MHLNNPKTFETTVTILTQPRKISIHLRIFWYNPKHLKIFNVAPKIFAARRRLHFSQQFCCHVLPNEIVSFVILSSNFNQHERKAGNLSVAPLPAIKEGK